MLVKKHCYYTMHATNSTRTNSSFFFLFVFLIRINCYLVRFLAPPHSSFLAVLAILKRWCKPLQTTYWSESAFLVYQILDLKYTTDHAHLNTEPNSVSSYRSSNSLYYLMICVSKPSCGTFQPNEASGDRLICSLPFVLKKMNQCLRLSLFLNCRFSDFCQSKQYVEIDLHLCRAL